MWTRSILLVSSALIALGTATICPKRRMSPIREILCYTSALDVRLLADSICSCTTLVHLDHDAKNLTASEITDLRKSLKEIHPPLQFVISIHDTAKTLKTSATVRQETIARIIAVLKEVDGIELNVTAGSKERFHDFVKDLKDEMIRKSYDKRILVSLPSKSEDLAKQFDVKELSKYVDLFTLPTDYLTDDDGAFVTFHPSRLMGLFDMLNTDSIVDLISGLGAPKEKILVSVSASAYKFLLRNETENAPRSRTVEKEPIAIDRKQLCEAMKNGEWTVERDEDLTAPYMFQNRTWIAFEDKISVGIKGKYALLRDLAGLAVHNVEDDTRTDCEKPLVEEIYRSFVDLKRKSRQAVLNALEEELHQAQFSYPNEATKTSSFRVVRVVDTSGHIRAVREDTRIEFVCKRQGYFVHPRSCNRFYRCVKFNQAIEDYSVFEFDCPAGLSFDERTEVCVWPGSLPQGTPCPGSSEIAPVTAKRFECPSQPGYYADSQNCRWFFACMDLGGPELMAFEFRCPYGLVFDEKKLVCEWPWLVPACSESSTIYTRTEYEYGGRTSGVSAGTGGYVTGGLPEYSVTAGSDYSKTSDVNVYETGGVSHLESVGDYAGTVDIGHAGSSIPTRVDYSKSTGYQGGSVTLGRTHSETSGVSPASVKPIVVADGVTGGYLASSNRIGGTGYSVSTAGAGTGYSQTIHGVNVGHTGFADGVNVGHTGFTDGVNVGYGESFGRNDITTGYSASAIEGYSGTVGGILSTKTDTDRARLDSRGGSYSTAGESNHSGASGTGYFQSTEFSGSSTYDRASSGYVGTTGLDAGSNTLNVNDYSAPAGVYPATAGPQSPSGGIDSSFGIISGSSYTSGTGITGSSALNVNDYSAPAGVYPATARPQSPSGGIGSSFGATSGSSYTSNTGITGFSALNVNDYSAPAGVYAATAKPQSPSGGIRSSFGTTSGSSYTSNTGITGSSALNVNDYSVPAGVYPATAGPQSPSGGIGSSFGTTSGSSYTNGITTGSIDKEYLAPTGEVYRGPTSAGVSEAANGINVGSSRVHVQWSTNSATESSVRGSTGIGRIPGTDFVGGAAKAETITPAISLITERTDITSANSGTRFTGSTDASSTRNTYDAREGYTIPVFVQQQEFTYPNAGTNNFGVTGGGIDSTRPSLNVSIFGSEVPADYGVEGGTTGAIFTANSIEENTFTGDSSSGTVLSHGGTSGIVSTASIEQGGIVTGVVRPGYVHVASHATPGYIVNDQLRTVEAGSQTVIHGTPTPAITLIGPPAPGVVLKSDATPTVLVSGQNSAGVSIGGSVAQPGTSYAGTHGSSDTSGGSVSYSSGSARGESTPAGSRFAAYDTRGYPESDVPDYRPTSVTLADATRVTVSDVLGTTGLPRSTTATAGYPSSDTAIFTPSGFTKTGPTRTGITTALLGGGGSYSVATSERRPVVDRDNIGERAFAGNVAGHTTTSRLRGYSSASTPPGGYQSTDSTPYSSTYGYAYPKPTVQLGTAGLTSPTPRPFFDVQTRNEPSMFDSGILATSADRYSPPVTPIASTTEYPDHYQTTLFEAARIPVAESTPRPAQGRFNTPVASTNIPGSSDVKSVQRTDDDGRTESPFSTGPGVIRINLHRIDHDGSGDRNFVTSASPPLGYLPQETDKSRVSVSTERYDESTTTGRPGFVGVTYREPSSVSDVTYKRPFSVVSPTTFRPTDGYYSTRGFSVLPSTEATPRDVSPSNVDISRDKIDKLLTNYDRGTVKYVPNAYDAFSSGPAAVSTRFPSSFAKSSSAGKSGDTSITPSSYEVTTNPPDNRGKVIVKWSDLHPLLLGKLGAECTCKADPFATLRGPGKKPIASSKGQVVDLANYDESDVYVDLEDDGSSEEGDYTVPYNDLSPKPYKISPPESTSLSTSYPTSSSSTISARNFVPAIDIRAGTKNARSDGSEIRPRAGKRLKDPRNTMNSIAVDDEDDADQIIDGATDCARPGLFRHPSLCNKFYACHWDQWKKKFTLHIFNCPIHLTFDSRAGACNWPSRGPACQAGNLLL